jgi:hypothetical protein
VIQKGTDVIQRFLPLLATFAAISTGAELKTAFNHSMQYYLSLPNGWSAGKQWPVVIVIEDANRQFEAAAARFEAARGDVPCILGTARFLGCGCRSPPSAD